MLAPTIANEVVVTPARIMETALAFWPSKILLTAVKLDLFSFLSQGNKTAAEIRSGLNLHSRGIYDFLDTLVALNFLRREGLKENATYCNTMETEIFLNKAHPAYVGGLLIMANNRLYPFWNHLEDALKTGEPQNEVKHGNKPVFEELYEDQDRLEEFVHAMAGIQTGNFIAFARQFDFSDYSTHCDIGGAGGHLSAQIALHQPHMQSITFDLPAVAPVAERNLKAMNVLGQVSIASGDFFTEPFPKADLITMGNILHDWDLENKKLLIRKAYEALPDGGAFAVIENVIDDQRKENAFGLMMSLNMLIETAGGFDFTASEFIEWAREAGFKSMKVMHLTGPTSALVAFK
ncbi:MAG TPA: methyltransferase [Chitinophagaceae bacterium]